jgi:hypothetical protein
MVDVSDDLAPGAHRVPRAWFEAHVRPIEPYDSLDAMARELCDDPLERDVIDALTVELAAAGAFREPLRVSDGVLVNGCHRFAAHVLAGSDHVDIWVSTDDCPDPYGAHHEAWEMTFRAWPPERLVEGSGAEPADELFGVLRSFPVAPGWVDCDFMGVRGDAPAEVSVLYYLSAVTPERAAGAALERLGRHGWRGELVTIEALRVEDLS